MKTRKGFSTAATVVTVIFVAVLCVGTAMVINRKNNAVQYDTYVQQPVVEKNDDNGQIGDHVRGSADALVVIHEYANFQCSHCATMNPIVEKMVNESNGQVAVVFRNMTWSSFPNSKAAAAAAEAAGLQGYWAAYADKLFNQQGEWSSATGDDRTELFERYFQEVSNGEGNMDQFRTDVTSDVVMKKIEFDSGMAKQLGVEGTPAFYYENQHLDMTNGGDLIVNGETVHYDAPKSNEEFVNIVQKIIDAKNKSVNNTDAGNADA